MADYSLNNLLVSESSIRTTPQDSLSDCKNDFTSVFGNFGDEFLEGMPLKLHEENEHTPFAYSTMMNNIFMDNNIHQDSYSELNCYDEHESPGLQFEC